FALVLSIGIVVDDAIVVVEAIHAKMETEHMNAYEASVETMGEITSAILSITMVMAAVFIPVGFMQGPSGVFYRQFAYTLAIAILISAVNALTLSPALCALLLKRQKPKKDVKRIEAGEKAAKPTIKERFSSWLDYFFTGFNAAFERMTHRYIKSVVVLIK